MTAPTIPPFPAQGQTTTIGSLPEGTTSLKIIYQPDAPIASETTIEVDGTSYEWVPEKPGIVTVQPMAGSVAVGEAAEVSVRFDGVPALGVIVCLVAATLLIGGATWATRLLLHPDAEID